MPRLDDISQLDSLMFEAALGELPFECVLEKLVDHYDSGGGVIFELNRKTGQISDWIGPGLQNGAQEYIDHLNAINPRMRYSLRHAPGHVAYEARFISEAAIDRSEFYEAIQRVSNVRYFLGTRLYDEGDISVFHSIEFEAKHGHPDNDKINAFSRTSGNLAKAWKLSKSHPTGDRQPPHGESLYEHLPWAVFSLDAKGAVVTANRAANRLINEISGLHLIDGELLTNNLSLNDSLRHLLAKAALGTAGFLLLPLQQPAVTLIVQTLPMPGSREAKLFIRDPRQYAGFLKRAAPAMFGLTPSETRILSSISRGLDLQNVADELALTRNTVRNHLQNIYRKTGVRNRGELMAQMLGLIDPEPSCS
ncbi:MAG: LuxR C-terminal-related transcriptional regulator [Pseudolabrys sp.]|nr:LuxR C-terminal-related transcriptional regulator [Pseudolabrys sp.]